MPSAESPLSPSQSDKVSEDGAGLHSEERDVLSQRPQQGVTQAVELAIFAHRSFSGPIPPPEVLREYDLILPGLGQTIVRQWTSETSHRHETDRRDHELQKEVINGSLEIQRRGQDRALWVCLAFVAAAIVAFILGYPIQGAVVACGNVAVVVALFLGKRNASRKPSSIPDDPPK